MQESHQRFRWEHGVAAGLLAVMSIIAFLNILGRYLFHYSLAFTEEVSIHCFVWLTVVGSGLAFERGSQLGMVTLYRHFPKPMQVGIIWLNATLGTALFIAVDVLLIRTIYYEMTLFHARSPALGIPIWIYYAGVPLLSVAVFSGIVKGTRTSLANLRRES